MISVVIPTYNRLKNLKIVLSCLELQNDKNFEVVISDQASTDGTEDYIRKSKFSFPIKHVYSALTNKSGSRSKTRNIGVKNTTSINKFILFLDSDIIIPSTYIENAKLLLNTYKYELIFGRVDWLPPKKIIKKLFDCNFEDLYNNIPNKSERVLGTFVGQEIRDLNLFKKNKYQLADPKWSLFHNAIINKNIFLKVGEFDESYWGYGYEDMDMGLKLKKLGIYAFYSSLLQGLHIWHPKSHPDINHLENQFNLYKFIQKNGQCNHFMQDVDWNFWWFFTKINGGELVFYKNHLSIINFNKSVLLYNVDENYIKLMGFLTLPLFESPINKEKITINNFHKTYIDEKVLSSI